MKTAPDTSEAGQVVQTTTTRRVLPSDSAAADRKTPEFWQYIENVSSPDWERHLLYIYRVVGAGPMVPLEKCTRYIVMPDQSQVALNDHEEVEFAIAKKYGGGVYRLILKRGSERVTEGRVQVEGPPKVAPPMMSDGPTVSGVSEASATADVAHHAISTVANSEKQAVDVAVTALRGAAEVVQRFSQAPGAPAADDPMRLMMMEMMRRALAPPPDPMDQFTKFLTVVNQLRGGAGDASNPLFGKVMEVALNRVLDPTPTGPVSSTGAELVRTLPAVASHIGDAVREWRIGSEAQLATAAMMAGKQPPAIPGAPPAVLPPGAPGARPPATVMPINGNAPPEGQVPDQRSQLLLELAETKIIEILKEGTLSAEQAADEAMAFLDRMDPTMPAALVQLGEAGLLQLFQTRPILRAATQNLPRLQEFIKAFLKYAAESERTGTAGKPN